MSAFITECQTFYLSNYGDILLREGLAQGASRSVNGAAEVAHIVYSPALAFPDHQHFILPAVGTLLQFYTQRNVAGIGIRYGGGVSHIGAVRCFCAA